MCVELRAGGSDVQGYVQTTIFGTFRWKVDWIHLYRNGTYLHSVSAGPTGWMYVPNFSFWTGGYRHCPGGGNFRAVARIRIGHEGFLSGPWVTRDSRIITLGCTS